MSPISTPIFFLIRTLHDKSKRFVVTAFLSLLIHTKLTHRLDDLAVASSSLHYLYTHGQFHLNGVPAVQRGETVSPSLWEPIITTKKWVKWNQIFSAKIEQFVLLWFYARVNKSNSHSPTYWSIMNSFPARLISN